jgi:hypothetical protein
VLGKSSGLRSIVCHHVTPRGGAPGISGRFSSVICAGSARGVDWAWMRWRSAQVSPRTSTLRPRQVLGFRRYRLLRHTSADAANRLPYGRTGGGGSRRVALLPSAISRQGSRERVRSRPLGRPWPPQPPLPRPWQSRESRPFQLSRPPPSNGTGQRAGYGGTLPSPVATRSPPSGPW